MTHEIPIAQCGLDSAGLATQRDRYRRLAASVTGFERRPDRLLVQFAPDVEATLVEETLAVERDCCPLFRLGYEPSAHRLHIGVDDDEQRPALDALHSALSTGTDPGPRTR
jgi:hypothetical protein